MNRRQRAAPDHSPRRVEAEGAPASAAASWMPWLLPALCLLLVALMSIDWLPACDLWWQLKTGEIICRTHSVPHREVFSFTAAGQPWYVQEWLAEVLLYSLYRWVSPEALVLYKVVGGVLALGLVLWRSRLRGASLWIAVAVTALAAHVARPFFDMRPQMLTYVMLSLSLLLLDQWRRSTRPQVVWALPAVALLWVNVHAGFVLLFALLGVEILDLGLRAWDTQVNKDTPDRQDETGSGVLSSSTCSSLMSPKPEIRSRQSEIRHRLATLGGVSLLCVLAGLLNPNGLDAYRYPILFLRHQYLMTLVAEWTSPNFHLDWTKPLGYLLLLLAFSLSAPRPGRLRDLLLMVGLIHSVLFSVRHMPVFAIVCAPIVAEGLEEMRRRTQTWMASRRWSYRRWGMAAALGLGGLLSIQLVTRVKSLPPGSWFAYCAVVPAFPTGACDYLLSHPEGSRLYNHYPWGGYCIWRLWPRYRVFLDGRAEVYVNPAHPEESALQALRQPREDLLRRWKVETVLLPTSDPFAQALAREPGWRAVYQDDQAMVLRSVSAGTIAAAPRRMGLPQEAAK